MREEQKKMNDLATFQTFQLYTLLRKLIRLEPVMNRIRLEFLRREMGNRQRRYNVESETLIIVVLFGS